MHQVATKLLVIFIAIFVSTKALGEPKVLGDLPRDIVSDIVSIIIDGIVKVTGNCTEIPDNEVEFWFYSNKMNPTILKPDKPSEVDTSKPIKILIHGFINDVNVFYIEDMKNAYLNKSDKNQVIGVDWSSLAHSSYFTAFCNLPEVAEKLGRFICNLHDNYKLDLSKLHIVGHSMGAQMAGIAGKYVKNNCGTVGRITGLDPAGPLYQGLPDKQRLVKDDADFVDVIHTNSGVFGYVGDCGSVDFYVNCGSRQPGCLFQAIKNITSIDDILKFPLNDILCNHQRSCMYYAESIGNGKFVGSSCSTCPILCSPDIIMRETLIMGESTPRTFEKKKYLVFTNSQPPYAKETNN